MSLNVRVIVSDVKLQYDSCCGPSLPRACRLKLGVDENGNVRIDELRVGSPEMLDELRELAMVNGHQRSREAGIQACWREDAVES